MYAASRPQPSTSLPPRGADAVARPLRTLPFGSELQDQLRNPLTPIPGGEDEQPAPVLPADAAAGQQEERHVPSFSLTGDVDWKNWRQGFELAARVNRWSHGRAKQMLAASMGDDVWPVVADAKDPGAFSDVALLLDMYETRILDAESADDGQVIARHALHRTSQATVELTLWHIHLRAIYSRAYPRLTSAALEQDQDLISQFVQGLKSPKVRAHVHRHRPMTYTEALLMAQDFTLALLDHTCSFCGKKGHQQEGCFLLLRLRRLPIGRRPPSSHSPAQLERERDGRESNGRVTKVRHHHARATEVTGWLAEMRKQSDREARRGDLRECLTASHAPRCSEEEGLHN